MPSVSASCTLHRRPALLAVDHQRNVSISVRVISVIPRPPAAGWWWTDYKQFVRLHAQSETGPCRSRTVPMRPHWLTSPWGRVISAPPGDVTADTESESPVSCGWLPSLLE